MNKDIAEIYILLGRIQEQIKYLERHIDNIVDNDTETNVEDDFDDNQYNPIPNEESAPECVYTYPNDITTVSKYNPIRSIEYPQLECFENRYDIHSTQACDIKETTNL